MTAWNAYMLWALVGVCLGLAPLGKVAWPFSVEAGTSSYRAHSLVGQAPSLRPSLSGSTGGLFSANWRAGRGLRMGTNREDKSWQISDPRNSPVRAERAEQPGLPSLCCLKTQHFCITPDLRVARNLTQAWRLSHIY